MNDLYLASNLTVSFGLGIPLSLIIALLVAKRIPFRDVLRGIGYSLLARLIFNLINNALYEYNFLNPALLTVISIALSILVTLLSLHLFRRSLQKDPQHNGLAVGLGYGFIENLTVIIFPVIYNRIIMQYAASGRIYEYFPEMARDEVDALVAQVTSVKPEAYIYTCIYAIGLIVFYILLFSLFRQDVSRQADNRIIVIGGTILFHALYQTLAGRGHLINAILLVMLLAALIFCSIQKKTLQGGLSK